MMTEEIIVISIIFGSGVAIVSISLIYSLIKKWINRGANSGVSQEEYDNLLQDLERFEASVNKRLQNLEAIAADDSLLDNENENENEKENKNLQESSRVKSSDQNAKQSTKTESNSDIDMDRNEYQSEKNDTRSRGKGLDNMLNS